MVVNDLIKRATCALHRRIKSWHDAHSDIPCDCVIISPGGGESDENYISCGTLKTMTDPDKEVIVFLFYDRRNNQWAGALDAQGLLDYVPGVFEDPSIPQKALIATTGLEDKELAALLKVKPATVKKWYTTSTVMAEKVVNTLVNKYLIR